MKPSMLELRSDGKDGLLLKSVSVKVGSDEATTFSPRGRYIMCRKTGVGTRNCIYAMEPSVEDDGEGKVCNLPKDPVLPKLLKSSFKAPLPGSADVTLASAELKYAGFEIWMDCTKRSAYRFEYIAYKDCGNLPRHGGFMLDPQFPKACQQKNGQAYPRTDGVAFDRGHLVPANHLDGDALAIKQSNFMTNILPQAAMMNRGAWLRSEETIECWREKEPLHVLGGALWDSSESGIREDWFTNSHYVPYPIFFWKVVTASTLFPESNHRIAWLVPNSELGKRNMLSSYVVSLAELEKVLAKHGQPQTFDVPEAEKNTKPTETWALPQFCDKSRR
jgi:endonuclease G